MHKPAFVHSKSRISTLQTFHVKWSGAGSEPHLHLPPLEPTSREEGAIIVYQFWLTVKVTEVCDLLLNIIRNWHQDIPCQLPGVLSSKAELCWLMKTPGTWTNSKQIFTHHTTGIVFIFYHTRSYIVVNMNYTALALYQCINVSYIILYNICICTCK